ncbi:nitrogen fixation protein [Rhizobium lemnae]|uniref:Type VI secretion system accessory protein TagJ n=1 Tax=Rhizobium lemnae TaxID=1214924 RepID=A0ABV8EB45_9HYPH|nr:type VI secretion system accessory protein TagJ [Rhizobium lemnae]MCJ8510234.1 nitrogen fixation protein [Rhizobium lemnae]
MSMFEQISALVVDGKFELALEQVKTAVRERPSDADVRNLYIDLLIITGDFERADHQCGIAATLQPDKVMGFALLRNQLRGMAARNAWFDAGALPEFPGGPTECDRRAIQLALAHRDGDRHATIAALNDLEDLRGERPIRCNGTDLDEFRDLDDRIPHALEVIMSGGAYLWIDFLRIAALNIEPVTRLRDIAFRPAQLTLIDGAVAPVLLPAIYYQPELKDPLMLIGHSTEWLQLPTGLTVGQGQRCFLAGDDLLSLNEIRQLTGISPEADAVIGKLAHA